MDLHTDFLEILAAQFRLDRTHHSDSNDLLEDSCRSYLELVRWPDGPRCPACNRSKRVRKLLGKSHRRGLHQCNACRRTFTVTVGTIFQRTRIPLYNWLVAVHLMSTSTRYVSARTLHLQLRLHYASAWLMAARIRAALKHVDEELGPHSPPNERFRAALCAPSSVLRSRISAAKQRSGNARIAGRVRTATRRPLDVGRSQSS